MQTCFRQLSAAHLQVLLLFTVAGTISAAVRSRLETAARDCTTCHGYGINRSASCQDGSKQHPLGSMCNNSDFANPVFLLIHIFDHLTVQVNSPFCVHLYVHSLSLCTVLTHKIVQVHSVQRHWCCGLGRQMEPQRTLSYVSWQEVCGLS